MSSSIPTSADSASSSNAVPETHLLPAPEHAGDDVTTVEVGGQAMTLDKLGPVVVNSDGTLSRIANWAEMTDRERATTMRVLVKRNQIRLADQVSKQTEEDVKGNELMSATAGTS